MLQSTTSSISPATSGTDAGSSSYLVEVRIVGLILPRPTAQQVKTTSSILCEECLFLLC